MDVNVSTTIQYWQHPTPSIPKLATNTRPVVAPLSFVLQPMSTARPYYVAHDGHARQRQRAVSVSIALRRLDNMIRRAHRFHFIVCTWLDRFGFFGLLIIYCVQETTSVHRQRQLDLLCIQPCNLKVNFARNRFVHDAQKWCANTNLCCAVTVFEKRTTSMLQIVHRSSRHAWLPQTQRGNIQK